ncbi:hypothetical protein QJQ45_007931 [Haematococcus lacustris]|nr:hypothetical protein QJQ45_007931 [Haematococcus lacustris]
MVVENINQHFCKSPARTQKYKQLCHSLGLKGQLIGRAALTRWLSLRKPAERLVRDISRAIFVEDLMQEVALTANKITAMYSGPSPFSALDFPELTAFTNVAGPGSCLVYNGSGHLALQPHGSGSMTVQSDEADSDSEDVEEVGSRQAAADMETTFGEIEEEEEGSELCSEPVQLYAIPPKGRRAALVPASDFQQHVDSAKQELAATADAVVRDLHSFLPPEHAKGLAVVYAHYWDKQPSDEDFLEPFSAAANPAKETTKLWRYLAGQPITKADILEYIKLAELALVMTPGLVEEERMFSAMAYLKDDTRNRLQECHLDVCARVLSSNQLDLDTFPDERAISKWLDNAAVRAQVSVRRTVIVLLLVVIVLILALKATWDALWEEYLKPRWRRQRLGLHHAQERIIEGFCAKVVNGMKWVSRHYYHQERGVAVFLGVGCYSRGGWNTNACFNFQRIGESTQRPLELCSWKDREALPPIGKEYQQGYKRVNDRLPKVKQRLHRAAEYRRGIDGRARNNA